MRNRPSIAAIFWLAGALCLASLSSFAEERKKTILLDQLTQSRAAELFQLGDYEEALKEFRKLAQAYPDDLLLRRYIGMTLTLLGRLEEAAYVLEEALKQDPENPALHYFLARTYHEQGARQKAEAELQQVLSLDPEGFYGKPAAEVLPRIRARWIRPRPWSFSASVGYEYDSNVSLEPNDKGLAGPSDQNASRFFFSANAAQNWIERGPFRSKLGYRLSQSLHDDSLEEFNFTFQEFSSFSQFSTRLFGHDVDGGFRYALPVGFLDGNLFSLGNEIALSVNFRLTKTSRTEIYHRYSHFEFGPDGQEPRLTSRDGEYLTTGIFHTEYFPDFRRYLFVGYEMEVTAARGDNFDRQGHGVQAGFHTPFFRGLLLDLSGGFTAASHPHFSNELVRQETLARRDNDWTFLVSLTYPFGPRWSLRSFYRYVNANNRNDVFQYDRQIGGVELLFNY